MTPSPKPALAELVASARLVSLPLRVRFRGVLEREVMLFEGPSGWTEWSPFVEYEDAEAATWLAAAIEFGWGQVPSPLTDRVRVNATLPAIAADQVSTVLARFGEFDTVKIKVAEAGQSIEDDLARIIATHEAHPDAKIRLDANGGFGVDEAVSLLERLVVVGIQLDYFEQPVATIAELAEARIRLGRLGVQVAADESVRKVSDPLAVAMAGAADVLVLKAQPLGGVGAAAAIANEAGLPWVVSSALESSIGISMGAHLAALSPRDVAHGLGTLSLFAGDVCDRPLRAVDGVLEVKRVVPSEARLQTFKAEDHRMDWWLERLERCYRLI
ncbi:MAG: o-succinylbenzoate synthase [Actinomycetales bacterium]|nr:o-succinylbenzoate synthase [Actinomycetales bacterium]